LLSFVRWTVPTSRTRTASATIVPLVTPVFHSLTLAEVLSALNTISRPHSVLLSPMSCQSAGASC
jgi:hypothetical protein